MIPYGTQNIDQKDINAIIKVLRSPWLTMGPKLGEFEAALAKYCGVRYAVAAMNGTAALHMIYLAAGLKKGDEVITTPNTFVATTNMLLAVGAKPVFCDIRPDTNNIDEEKIEKYITKKTKAIVPVHFAGHPCDMDTIFRIARKYKLLVIEDAAHALGAKYKRKKIGSLKSDMTMFSFHPVKAITMGEGGAVVTNNKKYYERLKLFRNHAMFKDAKGKNVVVELGYNYKVTEFQSALGLSQMSKLDLFIKKRHQVVGWYSQALKGIEEIILPVELPGYYSGWHLYIIKVKKPKDRDALSKYLFKKGIGVNFHYPNVYSQPHYKKIGYKNIKRKNADLYHKTCITLPLQTKMTKKDVNYIANAIKLYYGRAS